MGEKSGVWLSTHTTKKVPEGWEWMRKWVDLRIFRKKNRRREREGTLRRPGG
jgi:hypothetical protein